MTYFGIVYLKVLQAGKQCPIQRKKIRVFRLFVKKFCRRFLSKYSWEQHTDNGKLGNTQGHENRRISQKKLWDEKKFLTERLLKSWLLKKIWWQGLANLLLGKILIFSIIIVNYKHFKPIRSIKFYSRMLSPFPATQGCFFLIWFEREMFVGIYCIFFTANMFLLCK